MSTSSNLIENLKASSELGIDGAGMENIGNVASLAIDGASTLQTGFAVSDTAEIGMQSLPGTGNGIEIG